MTTAHAYRSFERSLADMRLVPEPAVRAVSVMVIAAEFSIALLLAIPWTVVLGFIVAMALTSVLSLAVVAVIQRGMAVRCACFGPSGSQLRWRHVARNLLLLAVTAIGLTSSLADGAARLHLAGAALAGLVALVGVAVVVRFDDLVMLFSNDGAP